MHEQEGGLGMKVAVLSDLLFWREAIVNLRGNQMSKSEMPQLLQNQISSSTEAFGVVFEELVRSEKYGEGNEGLMSRLRSVGLERLMQMRGGGSWVERTFQFCLHKCLLAVMQTCHGDDC